MQPEAPGPRLSLRVGQAIVRSRSDERWPLAISSSAEPAPLCPLTGRPAVRRVQWVTTRLLVDLWRIVFRTDVRTSLGGIDRIGLWESPTGLYFFDPPVEGDQTFYREFHAR